METVFLYEFKVIWNKKKEKSSLKLRRFDEY